MRIGAHRSLSWMLALALVLGGAGCGTPGDPVADAGDTVTPDAGDAAAPPTSDAGVVVEHALDLGTGLDAFEPIDDGAVLALIPGHQGLQHVYVSLRCHGMSTSRATVELSLTRVDDARLVSDAYRVRLPFDPDTGLGYIERDGIELVIPDPTPALDAELDLAARVEDGTGGYATSSARVTVVWAP